MIRRLIFPVAFGLIGAAILFSLGIWQLHRLEWKTGILAEIEARIAADPAALPQSPDSERDQYLSVQISGEFGSDEIDVLASTKDVGAIYRIIAPFRTTEGRRVLVDRGYVLAQNKDVPRPIGAATVTGNLLWPDEIDSYTPKPDLKAGIWFGRDIPAMADALNTEPLLVVTRETTQTDNGLTPLPVNTQGIPNNHLGYAIQWFGFCLVWLGMTGLLIWRRLKKKES